MLKYFALKYINTYCLMQYNNTLRCCVKAVQHLTSVSLLSYTTHVFLCLSVYILQYDCISLSSSLFL